MDEIDLLLVTHFHLDHAAALPYLLFKTDFEAPVYMTHATKAVYRVILQDFIKVSNVAIDDMLYDQQDLAASMAKITTCDYHQTLEVNGIKFWGYNAGHVLGAAMFMIEIAGVKILYTGDYSRVEDRHLMAAEIPDEEPNVLIVEATYGLQIHEPREVREERFTGIIHNVVKRGGRVLLPVFALGRAQELLLILDEFWENHPELENIPIYYTSVLASKCMTIYKTYINQMNERIRAHHKVSNPFFFKHISSLRSIDQFDDIGPSVVLATPGMLQSGTSRQLLEAWCSDRRNCVILAGYCVEGTLAKDIMSAPPTITTSAGATLPLAMSVHYISFSAHSDYEGTRDFIARLKPAHVVLVHGDKNMMLQLKEGLDRDLADLELEILTPENCDSVQLHFSGEKVAKIVGQAARKRPKAGAPLSGLIIRKDFNDLIMTGADLSNYSHLSTTSILQTQVIPFTGTFALAAHYLASLFDPVTLNLIDPSSSSSSSSSSKKGKEEALSTAPTASSSQVLIHDAVSLSHNADASTISVSWASSAVNDMLADAVVAILVGIAANPSAIKLTSAAGAHSHGHSHSHSHKDKEEEKEKSNPETKAAHARVASRLTTYEKLLSERFGTITVNPDTAELHFVVQDTPVSVLVSAASLVPSKVTCDSPAIKSMVQSALQFMDPVFSAIPPRQVVQLDLETAEPSESAEDMDDEEDDAPSKESLQEDDQHQQQVPSEEEGGEDEETVVDMDTVPAAKDYSSLRVPELRAELKARDLPSQGRKSDLVARLQESDAATE